MAERVLQKSVLSVQNLFTGSLSLNVYEMWFKDLCEVKRDRAVIFFVKSFFGEKMEEMRSKWLKIGFSGFLKNYIF